MENLGDKNSTLLLMGGKIMGNWIDGFAWAEEQILLTEAGVLSDFCKWLDNTGKSMGRNNYEERFGEYLEAKEVSDGAS